MSIRLPLTLASLLILVGILHGADQSTKGEIRSVSAGPITFKYDTAFFEEASVAQEPRLTMQEVGDGVPTDVWPAHCRVSLKSKIPLPAVEQGARYFFPADSYVAAFPLSDKTVKNFRAAYPALSDAAAKLRTLLRNRPAALPVSKPIPDFPFVEAQQAIRSKYQYLRFASGNGVSFLTQYAQDAQPTPANNEELTLVFEGLTSDGKYFVTVRLPVTHPSLPRGIDSTDAIKRDKALRYLRRTEAALNRMPDESFVPSLRELKGLIASLSVK